MVNVVLSLTEWRAVAHELAAAHTAVAPPGLHERVQALIAQAPQEWPNQQFALELDEGSAEAVRTAHGSLVQRDPGAGQREASVTEAIQIIHDHQHRS